MNQTKTQEVQADVGMARAYNVLAVRQQKAGYPGEARKSFAMRDFHMVEARRTKQYRVMLSVDGQILMADLSLNLELARVFQRA